MEQPRDPVKAYRSDLRDCLDGVGYDTPDAGNAIRVQTPAGTSIANIQTFKTEKQEISPVLIATCELLDDRPNGDVRDADVERLLPDMEPEQVRHALRLLKDHGYIRAYVASGGRVDSIQPEPHGLQATTCWPTPGQAKDVGPDVLMQVLDEQAKNAPTEEERGKAKRLREVIADTGTNVVSETIASLITRMTGMQ